MITIASHAMIHVCGVKKSSSSVKFGQFPDNITDTYIIAIDCYAFGYLLRTHLECCIETRNEHGLE
ncbi:MAG: hypothetical protein NVS9B9_05080 [Ktedonobacteraceae bacterium]